MNNIINVISGLHHQECVAPLVASNLRSSEQQWNNITWPAECFVAVFQWLDDALLYMWDTVGMLSHQLLQHIIDGKKAIIQNPTEAQRSVYFSS